MEIEKETAVGKCHALNCGTLLVLSKQTFSTWAFANTSKVSKHDAMEAHKS
ncbi:hypothetical protein DsansV1_C09g0095301 [Dioscorea sansibarensis]